MSTTTDKSSFHGSAGGLKDAPPNQGGGASTLLATIGRVQVRKSGGVIFWESGLAIDADGSPQAYHPNSALGLDRLSNAGRFGNWWGLATNSGKPSGQPLVQRRCDPAPGFYISTTALQDYSRAVNDPRRYVNASEVPFVVLPPGLRGELRIGDFALVINKTNGRRVGAIAADIGPADEIGEGSIALADALGIPSDPRTGGATGGIMTFVFADSRTTPAWPHTLTEINARVAGLVTQNQADLPAV